MHPTSFWTFFKSVGMANCDRARILAGFASIPLPDTMKPKSFPAGTPKMHFSGLSLMSYVRRLSNVSLKSSTRDSTCLADLFFQACLDHALVSGTSIFKPKRHSVETERPIRGDERRCGLVRLLYLDLKVSGVCIEETQ